MDGKETEEAMDKTIKYESANGYTGILRVTDEGNDLTVYGRDLREVLRMPGPAGDATGWMVNTVERLGNGQSMAGNRSATERN
jgi:hypothetical protein